jgi:inorganic pyrophosphatase
VKRNELGRIELISPLPCPFNYGSVPNTHAADGDREDVLLLGPRLARGSQLRVRVLGRVHFIDAGHDDAKWVCGSGAIAPAERLQIELFFQVYALAKRLLNALRWQHGPTRYAGLELRPE